MLTFIPLPTPNSNKTPTEQFSDRFDGRDTGMMNHNCCKFPINYPSDFSSWNDAHQSMEVNYDGQLAIIESSTASWTVNHQLVNLARYWVHSGCSDSFFVKWHRNKKCGSWFFINSHRRTWFRVVNKLISIAFRPFFVVALIHSPL